MLFITPGDKVREVYISSTTTLLTDSSSPVNYPEEEATKHQIKSAVENGENAYG